MNGLNGILGKIYGCMLSVLVLLMLSSITAAPALADGGGPMRTATDEEKDFYQKVIATVSGAVPKPEAPWVLMDQTRNQDLPQVAVGFEREPWVITWRADWADHSGDAAYHAKLKEGAVRLRPSAAEEAKSKAMQAELGQKIKAQVEAAMKGDAATAERLAKEIEPIQKQLLTVAEGPAAAAKELVRSITQKDVSVEIRVSLNASEQRLEKIGDEPALPGGATPIRCEDGGYSEAAGWREGTTWIFLGPWQRGNQGKAAVMRSTLAAGGPHTRVQTIALSIKAEKSRARKIAEKIDLAALRSLLTSK